MLQIKDLTITHKKDLRTIVENFCFVLNAGDKAVLIGEEGNGKSTLLKWICAPETIEGYAEAEGSCIYAGEKLGYLPQELPAEDWPKSIYTFFAEEELFWDQNPRERSELAGRLHFTPEFFYSDREMGTLSGGEKVKIQLARILTGKPTMLLLDEPSNDIDIETLEWLEKFIAESELPVLFVSHDETLIERTANVVIHLEQIRRKTVCRYTVARMSYRDYMEQRESGMKKQLQEARNDRRQEKNRQEKLRRIMEKVDHDQASISRQDPAGGRLLKKKMKAVKSMEKRFDREAEDMTRMPEEEEAIFLKFGQEIRMPAGKVVLDFHLDRLTAGAAVKEHDGETAAEDVGETAHGSGESGSSKEGFQGEGDGDPEGSFGENGRGCPGQIPEETDRGGGENGGPGEERILANRIDLVVRGAQKICIVGKNGAGKTTLMRQIAEELMSREDIRAAYMPQNYEEQLDLSMTPTDYLCTVGDKEERTRIRTFLGSMKYTAEEMSHAIAELSGGQKAKVLLLKMSLSGANVLILDEPTRNFSPLSNPVIREVLRAYGGTIISVSHDRKYIGEVCDTVYELTPTGLVRAAY